MRIYVLILALVSSLVLPFTAAWDYGPDGDACLVMGIGWVGLRDGEQSSLLPLCLRRVALHWIANSHYCWRLVGDAGKNR